MHLRPCVDVCVGSYIYACVTYVKFNKGRRGVLIIAFVIICISQSGKCGIDKNAITYTDVGTLSSKLPNYLVSKELHSIKIPVSVFRRCEVKRYYIEPIRAYSVFEQNYFWYAIRELSP